MRRPGARWSGELFIFTAAKGRTGAKGAPTEPFGAAPNDAAEQSWTLETQGLIWNEKYNLQSYGILRTGKNYE